jgi:hypothetical protein
MRRIHSIRSENSPKLCSLYFLYDFLTDVAQIQWENLGLIGLFSPYLWLSVLEIHRILTCWKSAFAHRQKFRLLSMMTALITNLTWKPCVSSRNLPSRAQKIEEESSCFSQNMVRKITVMLCNRRPTTVWLISAAAHSYRLLWFSVAGRRFNCAANTFAFLHSKYCLSNDGDVVNECNMSNSFISELNRRIPCPLGFLAVQSGLLDLKFHSMC